MKKVLKKMFILLFIAFIPFCVNAKKYESDLTSINSIIKEVYFEKVHLLNFGATKYFNYNSTGKPGLSFSGSLFNEYSFDVDITLKLILYDKNNNVIDSYLKDITLLANDMLSHNVSIAESDVKYKISDVNSFAVEANLLTNVNAVGSTKKDNYYFEDYNIKVVVNNNNNYNVEESFLVNFKNSVVPIQKEIPLLFKYTREDGTRVKKKIELSDVELSDSYETLIDNGKKIFNIGKVDKVSTKKNYFFKYNYNAGKDKLKLNDEFVFFLINEEGFKIDGLSFEIVFPQEIDESKISFIDKNGLKLENVKYSVDGNILSGSFDEILSSDMSIAVNVLLEEGYFTNCSSNINFYMIMSYVLPVFYTIFSFILVFVGFVMAKRVSYKGGLCFNKSINSLELGFLYSGKVQEKDIASLILCLANKGYIKINKLKKEYRIIKVKDYVENDIVEKTFMDELFKEKNTLSKNDIITSLKNLKEKIQLILENGKKKKVFNDSIFSYKILFLLMIINIIVVMIINLLVDYQPSVILINILISGVGYLIVTYSAFKTIKPLEKMLYILLGLILITVPIVLTSYKAFEQGSLYIISYILNIVCMLLIGGISANMSNRTFYGKRMYNKILAYKNYIIELDDETVDTELENNNDAFYEIMSYCFVLDIVDNIADKLKDKKLESPSWYNTNSFNLDDFYEEIQLICYDVFLALKNGGSIE